MEYRRLGTANACDPRRGPSPRRERKEGAADAEDEGNQVDLLPVHVAGDLMGAECESQQTDDQSHSQGGKRTYPDGAPRDRPRDPFRFVSFHVRSFPGYGFFTVSVFTDRVPRLWTVSLTMAVSCRMIPVSCISRLVTTVSAEYRSAAPDSRSVRRIHATELRTTIATASMGFIPLPPQASQDRRSCRWCRSASGAPAVPATRTWS